MSERAARRRAARTPGAVTLPPSPPAVSTVILALLGVAVSAYLGWTKITGAKALFCTGGGGCDIVQASRWATLLGAPTAFWGTALYLAIAALAILGFTARRWTAALAVASAAVAFSVYLTAVSFIVLRTACPYCLVSLVIEIAILVDVLRWWRRVPGAAANLPAPRMLATAGSAAGLTVVAALVVFTISPAGATPQQVALARHLAATGAVMYGAYWCPHCEEQKEMFDSAASMLPYVECDPKGTGAQPERCEREKVKSFPTWVINGERLEGVQTLGDLSRASKFPG